MRMSLPRRLRRALSIFLACAVAWLPLVSVAGLACGDDIVQTGIHAHHASPAPDQGRQIHVCHSVCAACALLSSAVPVLQFALTQPVSNDTIAAVPRLDLPVQERPPRLI